MIWSKSFKIGLAVLTQYRRVTDRQTPSQPRRCSKYVLCISASCSKNRSLGILDKEYNPEQNQKITTTAKLRTHPLASKIWSVRIGNFVSSCAVDQSCLCLAIMQSIVSHITLSTKSKSKQPTFNLKRLGKITHFQFHTSEKN